MEFTQIIAALKLLKSAFKIYAKSTSEKKYKQLISSAISELLKEHPDINAAEAGLLAAEATGINPSAEFLRTMTMLAQTKKYGRAKKKAATRKLAKKKKRCAGLIKAGKRCKRLAVPPAKFCHLHKGWKPSKKKFTKKKR